MMLINFIKILNTLSTLNINSLKHACLEHSRTMLKQLKMSNYIFTPHLRSLLHCKLRLQEIFGHRHSIVFNINDQHFLRHTDIHI